MGSEEVRQGDSLSTVYSFSFFVTCCSNKEIQGAL